MEMLPGREPFQQILTDVSMRVANMPAGAVGEAVFGVLRELVVALDADCATLLQLGQTGARLAILRHCDRSGLAIGPSARATVPLSMLSRAARAGQSVSYVRLDAITNAADRDQLRRRGIRSGLAVPLRLGDGGHGMLCFTTHRDERQWRSDDVARARLSAEVVANALAIERSHLTRRETEAEVERLRDRFEVDAVRVPIVAPITGSRRLASDSPSMRAVLEQVAQVAPTTATVLLTGETGTGKEVLAQAIHDMSPRRTRPMVRVNCGAIPSALIESELFGRDRGAYTGAMSSQAGRFEMAEGSTVFLDEVAELPLDAQVKLLRVIQEREVERLGGSRPIRIDVRIIAATNKDLELEVAERRFREDLYYRLNVFPITLPPLRARTADIPTLVWTFIDEYARAFGTPITSMSKESLEALRQYAWPGNLRELRNIIERAVIVSTGPHLVVELPQPAPPPQRRRDRLADVEAEHIRAVLDHTGWRVRGTHGAAALLGLKPTTLESRLARLGLKREGGKPTVATVRRAAAR